MGISDTYPHHVSASNMALGSGWDTSTMPLVQVENSVQDFSTLLPSTAQKGGR